MRTYVLREVPIGIEASGERNDRDSVGLIKVPADKYWGAATQRALNAAPRLTIFNSLPGRVYRCHGYIKRAAAIVNAQAGHLPVWKSEAMSRAAGDLIAGYMEGQFPLPIGHSRSAIEADMNVNEVLANRAAQLLGAKIGEQEPIDPIRDFNIGQTPDGAFTASMCIAIVLEIEEVLVPPCSAFARAIERNAGQAIRLRAAMSRLDESEGGLHEIGSALEENNGAADAVNRDWQAMVGIIAAETRRPFLGASRGYTELGSIDAMLAVMAAVRGLAIVLIDIAESLTSSVAETTRSETMATICRHVIAEDQMIAATLSRGGATSKFAAPVVAASILNSVQSLGYGFDAMRRFAGRNR